MRKRIVKPIISFFILSILLVGTTIPALAYTFSVARWPSSTIRYYYDNYNSARGKSFIIAGASGWNGTDVSFVAGNAGNYNVYCTETDNPNVSWDGVTTSYYNSSTGYFTSQTLQLNRSKTNTWNNDGALQSVAIHEFGHSLGLSHTNGRVIMNPYTWGDGSRYGDYGITTIQSDDRNGANARY